MGGTLTPCWILLHEGHRDRGTDPILRRTTSGRSEIIQGLEKANKKIGEHRNNYDQESRQLRLVGFIWQDWFFYVRQGAQESIYLMACFWTTAESLGTTETARKFHMQTERRLEWNTKHRRKEGSILMTMVSPCVFSLIPDLLAGFNRCNSANKRRHSQHNRICGEPQDSLLLLPAVCEFHQEHGEFSLSYYSKNLCCITGMNISQSRYLLYSHLCSHK